MTSYSWCCWYLAHIHQTLNCFPEDFQPLLSTAMFLRPLFSWNSAKVCCFCVELSFKCWGLTSSGSSSQPVTLSDAVLVPPDSYSSSGIILHGIFYRTSQSFSKIFQCIHCFNRIFFIECSHCPISFPCSLSGIVCTS